MITPIGGRKVLIKPEADFDMKHFIEEDRDQWSNWFKRLYLWSQSVLGDERLTWIRITDLPLYAWSKHNIELICNSLGILVSLDNDTSSKARLDAIMALLCTRDFNTIQTKKNCQIRTSFVSIDHRGRRMESRSMVD